MVDNYAPSLNYWLLAIAGFYRIKKADLFICAFYGYGRLNAITNDATSQLLSIFLPSSIFA